MSKKLILILILIFESYVFAQQSDEKVVLTDISGSSTGGWKSGLTPGNGTYKVETGNSREGQPENYRHPSKRFRHPYKITRSQYVSRSTIRKSINRDNEVRIKIMQNGHDNTDIEDFSLAYDSGNEYRMSNTYGLQNTLLPLYVKVTYRTWNTFHAVQNDVTFEFTIFEPGTWDVTIFN